MPIKTITISTAKGGSGKSTLAQCLAVQLGRAALLDLDPQLDSLHWSKLRAEHHPDRKIPCAKIRDAGDVTNAKRELAGYEFLIIDTPPSHQGTGELRKIYLASDFVLVPIHPSPKDLRAAYTTVQALRALGVPHAAVLSVANPRTAITSEAKALLGDSAVEIAPVIITRLTSYPETAVDGRTPLDLPGQIKPKGEFREIEVWLREKLNQGAEINGTAETPTLRQLHA